MNRTLRQRLARLEAKRPEQRQVIVTLGQFEAMPDDERRRLQGAPDVELVVVDTGIPRGRPCEG